MSTRKIGIGRLSTGEDAIFSTGGLGGSTSPLTPANEEDGSTLINRYTLVHVLQNKRATDTERQNATDGNFITPADSSTTTLWGLNKMALNSALVALATDEASTKTVGINPNDLDAAGLGSKATMDINSTIELIRSLRAGSTQLQLEYGVSLLPPSGKSAILYVSAEDKATTNVFGIVKAHDRSTNFADQEGLHYIPVQELLDPNNLNKTIQPPFLRRFDPAGEVIDMAINVANIADPNINFGFLPCDGGTYNSSTYPELANLIAGAYGNPSPIGATFVVPNIPSDVPGGPNATKFIRI